MKAILLARVSTEEQKEAGNSLPSQLTRLEKYCNEKGLKIHKRYNFDESAWKTDRAEFKNIVESLKNSKEMIALCCDKIDRLIRNFNKELVTIEELRRKGIVELHFPSDNIILNQDSPATDLFRFTIGVSLAKYYSDSISDNVKRAYENKIKKGDWIGKAPLGYINVEDENGNKELVVDPERFNYIIQIFEMYSTGNYSLRKIFEIMKISGLTNKSQSNKPLVTSQIYHILNNPFYYGMMKIKNELYPHRYPTLISKELFEQAQLIMLGWQKQPFQHIAKPFIFRGMIKCADCGCAITPEIQKGHVYYSCTNYKRFHDQRLYVNEKDLLEPIYELLDSIKLSDEKIQALVEDLKIINSAENNFFISTIDNLQQEYNQLETRIDSLTDLQCNGKISEELYLRKIKQYTEQQKNLLEQIDKHDTADKNYYITANTIFFLAQRAREVFDSSEVPEKRQLLNFLLQNCELKGKKLEYQLKSPFDTILLACRCSEMLPFLNVFRTLDWKNIAFQLNLFELDSSKIFSKNLETTIQGT